MAIEYTWDSGGGGGGGVGGKAHCVVEFQPLGKAVLK